jgi:GNAT superfamily N-acetyltransferase
MSLRLRTIDDLERALAHAPLLDRHAEEFQAQFSDQPFPTGASQRFLRAHFGEPETLLLVAEDAAGEERAGICLIGAIEDPLLSVRTPTVLVLFVEPPWRHRGVARSLIQRALEILGDRGHPQLAARVGHNDDALISMGERWGFTRLWEFILRE